MSIETEAAPRTEAVPARATASKRSHRTRGWLMRRALAGADAVGLTTALLVTEIIFGSRGEPDAVGLWSEIVLFLFTLPVWLLGAKLFGLYDRDEERADHSTADDLIRVFLLATVGVFAIDRGLVLTELGAPDFVKMTAFWALVILCVSGARIAARTLARRASAYAQTTVIVGAGDVGQLVARKLIQHREYRMTLLGFVDAEPKERRPDLGDLTVIGEPDDLLDIVRERHVDRVIFAFSNDLPEELLHFVRSLRDSGVQVDIVPRLFDVIGPKIAVHTVEGFPLVGLPPVRIARTSKMLKRAFDVAGALLALVISAPLFAGIAAAIKLDSPGPVFFRQRRLGKDMNEFTLLKFRTMSVDADDSAHREYIAETMTARARVGENQLYKLDRDAEVTRVGRWLRKTSLDELPQLVNVLRGDMSLVGPRPCLPYEVQHFSPHHYDRFLVPAGLTGLWQVSARAHATFGEALELDVLYAHSWSFGLDLSLIARTPLQLLRSGTA